MLKASLTCALVLAAAASLAQEPTGGPRSPVATAPAGSAASEDESGGSGGGPQTTAAEDAQTTAAEDAQAPGVKAMSGMSILGNQEAPKSLVIVPWKSSEIGEGIGVSRALDTRIRPVDKEVFARQLRYYQLRSGDVP